MGVVVSSIECMCVVAPSPSSACVRVRAHAHAPLGSKASRIAEETVALARSQESAVSGVGGGGWAVTCSLEETVLSLPAY